MGTAHVATIHFHERVVDRKQFQFGTFTLPAVPLGDAPVVIAIPDKIQIDRGPFKDSMRGNQRSVVKFPETGQVIAHDIVKECTASGLGMTEGCHPGTWVVRESMPLLYEQDVFENGRLIAAQGTHQKDAEGGALWRPATDEEKAVMWAEDLADAVKSDAAYAEMLIAYANSLDERLWAKAISPVTKAAAKHYSITTAWNTKAGALERMPCPHCGEQVVKTAAVCRFCTRVVDPVRAALNEEKMKNMTLKGKADRQALVAA